MQLHRGGRKLQSCADDSCKLQRPLVYMPSLTESRHFTPQVIYRKAHQQPRHRRAIDHHLHLPGDFGQAQLRDLRGFGVADRQDIHQHMTRNLADGIVDLRAHAFGAGRGLHLAPGVDLLGIEIIPLGLEDATGTVAARQAPFNAITMHTDNGVAVQINLATGHDLQFTIEVAIDQVGVGAYGSEYPAQLDRFHIVTNPLHGPQYSLAPLPYDDIDQAAHLTGISQAEHRALFSLLLLSQVTSNQPQGFQPQALGQGTVNVAVVFGELAQEGGAEVAAAIVGVVSRGFVLTGAPQRLQLPIGEQRLKQLPRAGLLAGVALVVEYSGQLLQHAVEVAAQGVAFADTQLMVAGEVTQHGAELTVCQTLERVELDAQKRKGSVALVLLQGGVEPSGIDGAAELRQRIRGSATRCREQCLTNQLGRMPQRVIGQPAVEAI